MCVWVYADQVKSGRTWLRERQSRLKTTERIELESEGEGERTFWHLLELPCCNINWSDIGDKVNFRG